MFSAARAKGRPMIVIAMITEGDQPAAAIHSREHEPEPHEDQRHLIHRSR